MAGLLESLASGLKAAGGALNPQVYQDNNQEQMMRQQQDAQVRNLMLQQMIKGIESGAITPPAGHPLAGIVGPDAATQERLRRTRGEQEYTAALAALPPDATREQRMALAYKYLGHDQAIKVNEQELTRETNKQIAAQRFDSMAAQRQMQFETRMREMENANVRADVRNAFTLRHQLEMENLAKEAQRQGILLNYDRTGNSQFLQGLQPPQQPSEGRGRYGIQPPAMGGDLQGSPDIKSMLARIIDPQDRAAAMAQFSKEGGQPMAQPPQSPVAPPIATTFPSGDVVDTELRGVARRPTLPAPVIGAAPVQSAAATTPPAVRVYTDADVPASITAPAARRKYISDMNMAAAKAGMKADVNLAGGRESQQNNRIISGGNQAVAALQNIANLPITASTGIFGTRGVQTGLFNAAKETLAQKMTTQEVQDYNSMTAGLQRALGAIETSGMAVPVSLMHNMDKVLNAEGMSNITKLRNLAEIRQIIEKGMEVVLTNPRVPKEQKDLVQKIVDQAKETIPFTQNDITNLQRQQEIDPKITLADLVKLTKSDYPTATNAKGEKLIYKDGKWQTPQ